MDTVLGLSITPTTLGWVLAEGHGADGAILDRNELELHSGRNAQAIHTAEQLAAEVLLAHEVAAAGDHRLRVIGVTWNAEASAQAALLVESLTGAGFDNVVPVRRLRAIETLAQAIAPVIGYEYAFLSMSRRPSSWSTPTTERRRSPSSMCAADYQD